MPKIEVKNLKFFKKDKALQDCEEQFKNYCSIRRDLRKTDAICMIIIDWQNRIFLGHEEPAESSDKLLIMRASLMHGILLYARWFKSTNKKPMLCPTDFFAADSEELSAHHKLINYRDQYIAHNELDLLGEDRVWAIIDRDGLFVESCSSYKDAIWLEPEEMELFQQCVRIVHNKIDTEILPDKQDKLDQKLVELLGISKESA